MMTAKDIIEIMEKHQNSYWGRLESDQYPKVANDILERMMEQNAENAELRTKVHIYERIIESSNFKVAVIREKSKKEK